MIEQTDIRRVVIPCHVGCLRHVVGIIYFRWDGEDQDEPELYFETLHEPCEGFWMRLWRAFQFVVLRRPMGADSTLIGRTDAEKLIDACKDYIEQHDAWTAKFPAPDIRSET